MLPIIAQVIRAGTLPFLPLYPPEYLAQGLLWSNKKHVVGELCVEFGLTTSPQRPEDHSEGSRVASYMIRVITLHKV